MEAGGTISTEAGTLGELLTSCGEQVSGIGTWEGPSQESISEQVESFVGEYNAITTQMTAFAEACDTYLEYARLYKAMKEKEKERDAAEEKDKQGYQNDIDAMLEDLGILKGNISSALGDASSPSLTANALNASISGTVFGQASNQALVDSLMSEVGKTIGDYSGLGFHDGEWCADFVSQMLVDNGYDIKKSALAGDGDGTILGSLRETGAPVHLDLGAIPHGLEGSDEYDPDYSPQPGDVVVFNWDNDSDNDHTGFVVKDNGDGTITTIEGNTSGRSGGSCVEIKERDRSTVYGYATPIPGGAKDEDSDD